MTEELEAYEYENDVETESDSDSFECSHSSISNIEGSSICNDCGVKIDETLLDNETRYYGASDTRYNKDPSRYNQRKPEDRSLYADLEPLGFPQEIIECANEYYKIIIKNKIYRAKNRLSIVFVCTYRAYEDMQEPRVPAELAQIFKLDKKGISNGFKTFSKVFRKRPEKRYVDAIDLVPKLLSELNIERSKQLLCMDDIRTIYRFIKAKNPSFNSSNPQSIAAGLVYYYLKLNNVEITRGEFSKVVNLTDITFTKIACDINILLGTENKLKF
jgi:transcription initiation factor TFIIIB Brf1 subunit/transcription initiation factor TFIIB